jgi:hypothetical protein
MNNARRSNRFEVALMSLREEYDDDLVTTLIDLLADARHWCDHNDQSFAILDRQANQHYLAERNHSERTRP